MYKIKFYRTESGKEPAKDFLENLNSKIRTKAIWELNLLQEKGTELKKPYCDYLQDGIWELRIKFSSDIVRIFYFFNNNEIILLLNGFVKKTQKTPKEEIEKVLKYKKDFEERNKK